MFICSSFNSTQFWQTRYVLSVNYSYQYVFTQYWKGEFHKIDKTAEKVEKKMLSLISCILYFILD